MSVHKTCVVCIIRYTLHTGDPCPFQGTADSFFMQSIKSDGILCVRCQLCQLELSHISSNTLLQKARESMRTKRNRGEEKQEKRLVGGYVFKQTPGEQRWFLFVLTYEKHTVCNEELKCFHTNWKECSDTITIQNGMFWPQNSTVLARCCFIFQLCVNSYYSTLCCFHMTIHTCRARKAP